MRHACANCGSRFFSKRFRSGTILFCSRLCKRRWEHQLKLVENAHRRWTAYLSRHGP